MKKILFCITTIILTACSNNIEVQKPKKLIEEETMENILYDLALLQALKGHSPKELAKNEVDPKTYIYQKYKIDSLQFVENNRYYSADVQNYMSMFSKVIERLDKEKKAVKEIVKKETEAKQKKMRDSIANSSKK
jgi:hypothetical protein